MLNKKEITNKLKEISNLESSNNVSFTRGFRDALCVVLEGKDSDKVMECIKKYKTRWDE